MKWSNADGPNNRAMFMPLVYIAELFSPNDDFVVCDCDVTQHASHIRALFGMTGPPACDFFDREVPEHMVNKILPLLDKKCRDRYRPDWTIVISECWDSG